MALYLTLSTGIPRLRTLPGSISIYDEEYAIVGTLSAGTNIVLPLGQTYSSGELEVWLNTTRLDAVFDYNYIGTIPRTTIQLTFDVFSTDVLRFRIDRSF